MNNALLITIEGIDGSGKSTLVQHIQKSLMAQNIPLVCTKEPGGTELGRHLRSILQHRTFPLCSIAEYLIFAADRAQHFNELILPSLAQGKIVLSDRMGDSSVVYQGYARGLDIDMIKRINEWAMHGRTPDITFYLRISAQESTDRVKARNLALTAFEKEDLSFTQKLVDGFDTLFKNKPHAILLNGTDSIESLTTQTLDHITACIKNKQS
jgi:dTMP kinase